MKRYYIYILFSQRNGTLYIGVTSNLIGRVWEHKNKIIKGFTSKYNIDKLGYYEIYENINDAIEREKQLKKYKRYKKLALIESDNPQWRDLYSELEL